MNERMNESINQSINRSIQSNSQSIKKQANRHQKSPAGYGCTGAHSVVGLTCLAVAKRGTKIVFFLAALFWRWRLGWDLSPESPTTEHIENEKANKQTSKQQNVRSSTAQYHTKRSNLQKYKRTKIKQTQNNK